MSQNEKTALGGESGEPQRGSVFDFLYQDSKRIGAFLSQFDELGIPTRVSVSETVQKAKERAFKIGASGDVPGLGSASLSLERGPGRIGGENSEARDYDPIWANALALLDYLDGNGFLDRDIANARIGQLVIETGSLMISDHSLLRGIWENPVLSKAFRDKEIAMARQGWSKMSKDKARSAESDLYQILEMLPTLPHTVQARLIGKVARLWCNLSESDLIGGSSDIVLKHGAILGGNWNILGVLDAFPYDPNHVTEDGQPFMELIAEVAGAGIGHIPLRIAQTARNIMGRPSSYHAITPLLIFREVHPAGQSGI